MHHEGAKDIFSCNMCDKEFFESYRLKQHKSAVHDGVKLFECEFCDKSFSTKAQRRTHIKIIHEKLKNHKCEHCDKTFPTSSNLTRELLTLRQVK